MSNRYTFKAINDQDHVKYSGTYTQNGFIFVNFPYFTIIQTNYDGSSYSNAKIKMGNYITKNDINVMLDFGVKVDLVVKGKETADLILPLIKIDNDYAYFSNNSLTLKVNGNGVVTEELIDTGVTK